MYCMESRGDEDLTYVAVTSKSTIAFPEDSDPKTVIVDGAVQAVRSSDNYGEVVGPYRYWGTPASGRSVTQIKPGTSRRLKRTPYYLRGNTGAEEMRVWLPVHQPSSAKGGTIAAREGDADSRWMIRLVGQRFSKRIMVGLGPALGLPGDDEMSDT